jgi:hypothetical protein
MKNKNLKKRLLIKNKQRSKLAIQTLWKEFIEFKEKINSFPSKLSLISKNLSPSTVQTKKQI